MQTTQHIAVEVGLSPETLANIVAVVRAQVRVRRIVLFGSRTRGNYAPTSDIDIALDLEPFEHALIKSEIEEQIRTLLRVDIVHLSKVPQRLRNEIFATGITLYEAA